MTDIIDELSWRGLIAITTDLDELRKALATGQVTVYIGFDPTAPGLHIGNLVQLLTLRRLQLAGHRPIGLVGGATGLIGDPSGKSAERVLNPREVVAEWTSRLRGEIGRFLDFDCGDSSAILASNLDWTQDLSVLDFLRDIGKHFPVNAMLARESVKARLEGGGITFTEFSYQLLQSMDYLELYRRHGCTLQVGGSDQWGNLVGGVDLIRRVQGASVHALATPLITKPDGTKYGKTEGGAIWISRDLMSPYAFYQFWINRADTEVGNLLRVFTFRTQEEIAELERVTAERPAAREAQRVLAQDVTTLVHGAAEYAKAVAASRALFGQGDLGELDEATLVAALGEVPATVVRIPGMASTRAENGLNAPPLVSVDDNSGGAGTGVTHATIDSGESGSEGVVSVLRSAGEVAVEAEIPQVSELMARAGIVSSRSAARRAISEGGAYVNNRKVTDENEVPTPSDLLHGKFLVLRRGKRTVGGVEVLAGPVR
ncbi:MAG TPA: tyrosine--tRNA ligase [Streptosporangiaceae bacterium]